MSHPAEFPPSPDYRARQAERRKELAIARARRTWTAAQFLAERDAAYVAEQRNKVRWRIDSIKRQMEEDNDFEGYVHHYGTDEG